MVQCRSSKRDYMLRSKYCQELVIAKLKLKKAKLPLNPTNIKYRVAEIKQATKGHNYQGAGTPLL